jgi:hypothetical protein
MMDQIRQEERCGIRKSISTTDDRNPWISSIFDWRNCDFQFLRSASFFSNTTLISPLSTPYFHFRLPIERLVPSNQMQNIYPTSVVFVDSRRKRMKWTNDLHQLFLHAIHLIETRNQKGDSCFSLNFPSFLPSFLCSAFPGSVLAIMKDISRVPLRLTRGRSLLIFKNTERTVGCPPFLSTTLPLVHSLTR